MILEVNKSLVYTDVIKGKMSVEEKIKIQELFEIQNLGNFLK